MSVKVAVLTVVRLGRPSVRLLIVAVALALTTTPTVASAKSLGPSLGVTPQTAGVYDYGVVTVGNHADQVFTLTNSGGTASAALVTALTGSSSFTKVADTCTGGSLGPGKHCTITIRYGPAGGSGDTATLSAASPKPAASTSVVLKGTGGVADVEISPSTHDFGSSSGSQTFTATNKGNISTSTYTFSGPTDQHFTINGTNTCTGTALAPNASCSFTVAFAAPASCGSQPTLYKDTVSLGSYASAGVSGIQEQCRPHLSWSPCTSVTEDGALGESLCVENFLVLAGWLDPITATFTLTNDGKASTGGLTFTFSSDKDGLFTLQSASGPGDCQNVSTLAVGASCIVTVDWPGLDINPCGDNWIADVHVSDDTWNDSADLEPSMLCAV